MEWRLVPTTVPHIALQLSTGTLLYLENCIKCATTAQRCQTATSTEALKISHAVWPAGKQETQKPFMLEQQCTKLDQQKKRTKQSDS